MRGAMSWSSCNWLTRWRGILLHSALLYTQSEPVDEITRKGQRARAQSKQQRQKLNTLGRSGERDKKWVREERK